MKRLLKFLGCARTRTKQLSSVELLKDHDSHTQKLDKSYDNENPIKNCYNIKKENIYTIEEVTIDNKETVKDFNGLNLNEEIEFDELLLSEDSPLICSYEMNKIRFSKKGLIDLFNELIQLEDWKNYWNKDNFTVDIRINGSPINSKFSLIRTIYTQKKSELKYNKSIDSFIKFMYEPKIRYVWDNILKNIDIIDGEILKCYIINTWAKSPIFLISERDSIEKRFIFKHNNNAYIFSTSVPFNFVPEKKNVVRIINYINFSKIYEDDDNYYFYNINQSDFKMKIPQFIFNVTLPMTVKEWYNNLFKACNSYYIFGNDIKPIEKNYTDN